MKSNDWRHKNVARYTPGNTKILYFFNCLLDGMHTKTALVRDLQLLDIDITREALVKIERGIQHIQLSQLKGIRDVLQTTYDELLEIH